MSVAIFGNGWLGNKLFLSLKKEGLSVSTFSRSNIKSKEHLSFNLLEDSLPSNLSFDTIIFTIPLVRNYNEVKSRFDQFLKDFPTDGRLIYISSTSVFGENQGHCTEEVAPCPSSSFGIAQRDLELLIEQRIQDYTIIRSGGQIGGGRFPKPKKDNVNNISRVNLIDQSDLIRIIKLVMDSEEAPRLIHAVSPYHPSKGEYYFALSINNLKEEAGGKVIDSKYLRERGFSFTNEKLKK